MAKITRSIDQVIFKHAPGSLIALEEGGMYGVITAIKGKQDHNVDKNMMLKKLKQYVKKWEEESEKKVLGFSSDDISEETIVAIKPEETVQWDFLPSSLFECTNPTCRVLADSSDKFFQGKCSVCSSKLKQFRYIWYHPCGVIRSFQPIPDTYCPHHGRKYLYLNDTGRFRTSTWRCRECQHESSLRMLPCPNVLCRKSIKDKREFFLQGAVWNDPWVYFSQVATFVNLKDDQIKPVLTSDKKDELLIAAYLGSIEAGQSNLKAKALEGYLSEFCSSCGAKIPINSKFCLECGKPIKNDSTKKINIEINKNISLDPLADDSDLAIFAAVRDLERTISLKDERNKQREANDIERLSASDIVLNSLNKIGIDDIYLIGDFPLTHIAYGYSRFQSKPPAWLRAFPSLSSSETKVPVYTNCVTTEAWMIQLSAKYMLDWLYTNKLIGASLLSRIDINAITETDAKLFLLELLNKETKDEEEVLVYTIITQLIHSLSHTLLYSLALESGLDIASFGEILLPKSLSFIVYGGESDIGGLSASFHQGMSSLIDSFVGGLRSCKFDPSCSEDDDGACVGCLYLPRGCAEFNENLSRAYVFGGKTKHLAANDISIGYVDLKNK